MIIKERQMMSRRLPFVIMPVKPSVEFDFTEKIMTKVLHGDEVRKCEGIQRPTETNATKPIYTDSPNIEDMSLYCQ
jgi:hypothetical protein